MLGCVLRSLFSKNRPAFYSPALRLLNNTSHGKYEARSFQATSNIFSYKKPAKFSYFLLIIPGAAFCLGCWQVQRLFWKLDLIKQLEDKIALDPVSLPSDLSELSNMEYRRVSIKGAFDHSRELLMGPRPALHGGRYNETGSMVSSGSSGFLVVTPFVLAHNGETILVNRGWISKQRRNPSTRQNSQVTGEQELTGIIRLQENRGPFMPKNNNRSITFLYRDIETMSALTGSSAVFVDACDGVKDGPLAAQTRITLRNEHLSYLLTWYSLSLITSAMWYRRYLNPRAFI